ncbi:hypothetical protein JAAARDRAFT_29860 [Jaapia argillacea MUCL 33604]|uniref:Uncharacterized protein n=1 Tax=Jaapia argillacea MUCL 33604 TaxID=933084 RepID=A0A067Q9T2_9AGAM|nr:hypothetical protein JAAARDRAFT_29860 [Jaapia argillacea MUCL 33604]
MGQFHLDSTLGVAQGSASFFAQLMLDIRPPRISPTLFGMYVTSPQLTREIYSGVIALELHPDVADPNTGLNTVRISHPSIVLRAAPAAHRETSAPMYFVYVTDPKETPHTPTHDLPTM